MNLHEGGNNQRAKLGNSENEYASGHIYNALMHNDDTRSLIESSYGGSGSDDFFGNKADNLLYGNGGRDWFSGGEGNDYMDGGVGDDWMYGGPGDDSYAVDSTSDVVSENANEGYDTVWPAFSGYTLGPNFEVIALGGTIYRGNGNELDNYLQGNDADNYLWGKEGDDYFRSYDGNDILVGDVGNDTFEAGLGADEMYGGTGNDFYYVDNAGDKLFENTGSGFDTVSSSIDFTLPLNFESLILTATAYSGSGSSNDNTISGNAARNFLRGFNGDDQLFGHDGDDTLRGDEGADDLYGGRGNDVYIVHDMTDTIVEFANEGSNDRVSAFASHSLSDNVEKLFLRGTAERGIGNSLDNTITGNASANYLFGKAGNNRLFAGAGSDILKSGSGNDRMFGGLGDDAYRINSSGDRAIEGNSAGTDKVYSSVNFRLGSNLENLKLTSSALTGTGNLLNNRIEGNSRNNRLLGKGGADRLNGNAGNDRLFGGPENDFLNGGSGNDYLNGTDQTGLGRNEKDKLTGGSGNDRDTFVLGEKINNVSLVYYHGNGNRDRALIVDFDKRDSLAEKQFDVIQLAGNQQDYSLNTMSVGGDSGVGVKFKNDLLGFVKGYSASDLNLANTSQFRFV